MMCQCTHICLYNYNDCRLDTITILIHVKDHGRDKTLCISGGKNPPENGFAPLDQQPNARVKLTPAPIINLNLLPPPQLFSRCHALTLCTLRIPGQ